MFRTICITAAFVTFGLPVWADECEGWNTREFFIAASADDVASCLIAGANAYSGFLDSATRLHWVARFTEDPTVLELLLAVGADVNARSASGETPLFWAASFNKNPAVHELLLAAGTDVNARAENGRTPLYVAGRNANPAVLELLLAAGADVNARGEDGWTPLHSAGHNKNPASLKCCSLLARTSTQGLRMDGPPYMWRRGITQTLQSLSIFA